jgi:hypothetical protein
MRKILAIVLVAAAFVLVGCKQPTGSSPVWIEEYKVETGEFKDGTFDTYSSTVSALWSTGYLISEEDVATLRTYLNALAYSTYSDLGPKSKSEVDLLRSAFNFSANNPVPITSPALNEKYRFLLDNELGGDPAGIGWGAWLLIEDVSHWQ